MLDIDGVEVPGNHGHAGLCLLTGQPPIMRHVRIREALNQAATAGLRLGRGIGLGRWGRQRLALIGTLFLPQRPRRVTRLSRWITLWLPLRITLWIDLRLSLWITLWRRIVRWRIAVVRVAVIGA